MKFLNIKRTDLIDQLRQKCGFTKRDATSIVDEFSNIIIDNLRSGNTISIHNFGCFDILERKARSCPNPVTGETVQVPAHYIPRFYPSKRMREVVKEWEHDHTEEVNLRGDETEI